MTVAAAIGWSLLKSVSVTVLGTWLAVRLAAWLSQLPHCWRHTAWGALLVPCLTPSLMVGYCYRDTSLSLVPYPFWREVLYTVVVAAQTIPVAVLIIRFAPPPPVSETAVHCQTLFQTRRPAPLWLWIQSRSRAEIPAAALLFILNFQEADLATLLQAATWTEVLYTRHAGGLPLQESLRRSAIPAAIQLPWIACLLFWIVDGPCLENPTRRQKQMNRPAQILSAGWLISSLAVVTLIPAIQLWRGARQGWPALLHQPSTWQELFDALLIGVTAGGIAWQTVALLMPRNSSTGSGRAGRPGLLAALVIPGLFGNLVLPLALAAIFQTPVLAWAYDSPVLLLIGETFALLPKVAILQCCLSRLRSGTGDYSLELLSRSAEPSQREEAKRIRWKIFGRVSFGMFLLSCYWAYLEVMVPSILAMPGLVPVGLVLYNSLHYGRISALGAKLVLAMGVPIVLASGFLVVRRLRFFSR